MEAGIINIGDELLIGQILNTNAQWIGEALNLWGWQVGETRCIPDRQHIIESTLDQFSSRFSLVLVTGGLGPTKDDVTKKAICSYFKCGMRRDAQVLDHVEALFRRFKRPMLEQNKMQADIPEIAEVLFNEQGTAPGMWIQHQGCIFVFMAGVPREMKHIMVERVAPRLRDQITGQQVLHKHFVVAGIGESFFAEQIADLEDGLPETVRLAYLPSIGYIRLRLSASVDDSFEAERLSTTMDEFIREVRQRIGVHFIGYEGITLERALLDKLASETKKIATAESCTGGYLAHLLTAVPGSSVSYEGGAVSYSNKLKMDILGVSERALAVQGAVSEQIVREMAQGALRRFDVDLAVSVSGIAGPGGATEGKPVGTVWIAVASKEKCIAKLFSFGKERLANIERSAQAALFEAWRFLHEE